MPRVRRRPILLFVAAAVGLALLGAAVPRRSTNPLCARPEVRIFKSDASLELVCDGEVARTMPVTFGASPSGPKEREGDERTPEGDYHVSAKTKSDRFHRFLAVSYPNDSDLARAHAQHVSPGGGIGIHGTTRRLAGLGRAWVRLASATRLSTVWGPTDGCIGVTNEDAELLYDTVTVGTKVIVRARR